MRICDSTENRSIFSHLCPTAVYDRAEGSNKPAYIFPIVPALFDSWASNRTMGPSCRLLAPYRARCRLKHRPSEALASRMHVLRRFYFCLVVSIARVFDCSGKQQKEKENDSLEKVFHLSGRRAQRHYAGHSVDAYGRYSGAGSRSEFDPAGISRWVL